MKRWREEVRSWRPVCLHNDWEIRAFTNYISVDTLVNDDSEEISDFRLACLHCEEEGPSIARRRLTLLLEDVMRDERGNSG